MNISGFTTQTLIEFYDKVRDCLRKDDENPSADKVYGVRSFQDWRGFADAIEKELTERSQTFTPIQW
ncbi:hypothetical protein [Diaphorobacter limosus]|jgi:hypothetical protein|uniref:Uncharacterized protein n=1 Tax=Diaphorobacter limosus TaxID=3036128 RepID=A0ABZ0J3L4_9BURK|nr:hypothetical protein [Diaphorobacter sp. Y-1]WOO32274.1 hypothetical protein P4826_18100 [Diaphorobacter sp. Y-1]